MRPTTGLRTPRNTCSRSSADSGRNTVLDASYVGTQSHHLLVLEEANPGNPALCLALSNPANLAPGQTPCGPFNESNVFTTASGQVINGTRGPLGPNFGSDTNQTTIGNSNYNSLQVTLRHTSGPLQLLAAYTFSKSLDQSSNLGEEVNPLNPSLSRALSAFDITHNFVVSYNYQIPFERLLHAANRWTSGMGIFRDHALQQRLAGDARQLWRQLASGRGAERDQQLWSRLEPDVAPGSLNLNHNPRNGLQYFNAALFSDNALGTPGNASRRYFHGPGMENFDMALVKNLRLTESNCPAIPNRSVQRFQSRSVLRTASGGWQHQQRDVRAGGERGDAQAGANGREVRVLK